MATEAENNELQGLLSGILSRPDALQELLGVVAKLKESGVLENLLPLLGGLGAAASSRDGESSAKNSESNNLAALNSERDDREATEKPGEEGNGNASTQITDALPAPGLSLLTSLLSGGRSNEQSDHSNHDHHHGSGDGGKSDGNEEGRPQKKRLENHRRLLQALQPYLGKERRERVDFILKLLQLMELAGQIGLQNLFTGKT